MAFGDSLLNGMRSYSIDDARAASSIPALVGASLADQPGLSGFRRATYPFPILIDVEGQIARFATIENGTAALLQVLAGLRQIKADAARNARDWLSRFEAGPRAGEPAAYDNLAIAGARIEDAFSLTYAQLDARIAAMAPTIRAGDDPLSWSGAWPAGDPYAPGRWGFGDVHIALNSRHLRNPGNRDGLGPMTVLDVVGVRRPRALLVNMGANHGLVEIVMRNRGRDGVRGLQAFADAWPPCARALAGLPGVEAVVMALLPLPSQVPCLAPPNPGPGPDLEPEPPRPDRYFDRYVSAIDPISTGSGYDGDAVAEFDRDVAAINAQVEASTRAAFSGSGKALCFVSLAELLGRHDYKHRRGPVLPGGASGHNYSNYPLGRISDVFRPTRLRGGICGLDQIHPTTIGYRYVAEEVRGTLMRMIDGLESRPIAVSDAGDPFLLSPNWPTIALMDALYPRAAASILGAEVLAISAADRGEGDRLLFRPGWLR